jgi:putative lipoic acid-binding regulatory protein
MKDRNQQRPEITYPCQWGFKVIGMNEEAVREAIKDCLGCSLKPDSGERPYELGFSRNSDSGKYVSLTLDLEVLDEQERNTLYRALADHPEIKMVI